MSWRKLLCDECGGALEIDCNKQISRAWFNPYLWCESCQGGCDLESWIRWELIDEKVKNESS